MCVHVETLGWILLLNFVEQAWTDLYLCSTAHAYKMISADQDRGGPELLEETLYESVKVKRSGEKGNESMGECEV
jgi:hypothetical protein